MGDDNCRWVEMGRRGRNGKKNKICFQFKIYFIESHAKIVNIKSIIKLTKLIITI
jgi:hypothetical protein